MCQGKNSVESHLKEYDNKEYKNAKKLCELDLSRFNFSSVDPWSIYIFYDE